MPTHPTGKSNSASINGLLLSQDLFFSSKITGTATALGLKVAVKGKPDDAVQLTAAVQFDEKEPLQFIMIDLSLPGLNIENFVANLPTENRPQLIAYDAHVKTERLKAARDAGCNRVLPRGQFDKQLQTILQSYCR